MTVMRREVWQPAYIRLDQGGELAHRAAALYAILRVDGGERRGHFGGTTGSQGADTGWQ
jgi:hypothetical protein